MAFVPDTFSAPFSAPWLNRFDTVEQLRLALIEFMHTYNTRWLIQRHGYKTPNQHHADLLALTGAAA